MRNEFSKEQLRTFIVIFIVGTLIGLILLARFFFEGIVYTFFCIFGIAIMLSFDKVMKIAGISGDPAHRFFGISNKWVRGSIIGLIAGVGFLLLTQVKVFGIVVSMAIPQVPLALSGQGVVVCIIAPIAETVFFTMAVLSVLSLFMPIWMAILLKAGLFSVYHYWAYVVMSGNTIESVIGSFIGAGIFGILGSILAYFFGAESDIVAHGFFNTYNFNKVYEIFSVVN